MSDLIDIGYDDIRKACNGLVSEIMNQITTSNDVPIYYKSMLTILRSSIEATDEQMANIVADEIWLKLHDVHPNTTHAN